VHPEQRRRHADLPDRREIAHRVIRHVLVQSRIDGVGRHRRHQQGVTVGWRLCDQIGADVAAGAHLVLHHELLPQQVRHLRTHDARDRVGRAAGGEGNDDADRFGRILVLGFHTRAAEHECHDRAGENGQPSMLRVHGVSPRFYEYDSMSPNGDHQATCSPLAGGLD
jgi:hypothetical protein